MLRTAVLLALLVLSAAPTLAADPGEVADAIERKLLDRLHAQEAERAYDREMCYRVGYRGPDIEVCARDSAAWRRGARPGLNYNPDQYGTPVDRDCIQVIDEGVINCF